MDRSCPHRHVLLPGLLITGLMYADLSPDQWRIVIL
ncbi:DUF1435 domain-containing protein, partial [Escherichia coli]